MRFKIGDVVMIRTELKVEERYDSVLFGKPMVKHKGKKAVVDKIESGIYRLRIDGQETGHYWSDGMLMSETEAYWRELQKAALTDREVGLFESHLDWRELSRYAALSTEGWRAVQTRVDWSSFVLNENIPASTFNSLYEFFSWNALAQYRNIDETFLNEINENVFSTLTYFTKNKSAKNLPKDVIEKIAVRNSKKMIGMKKETRQKMIKRQVVSPRALDVFSKDWDYDDWIVISQSQPIGYEFAAKYQKDLSFDLVNTNPLMRLTQEQIDKLMLKTR